jgi:4-hydroxythreonine-4-phosphate dehydrogenase
MSGKRPILGITMGDPAGIGPEILAKALAEREIYEICKPLVIGSPFIMEKAMGRAGVPAKVRPLSHVKDAGFTHGVWDVYQIEAVGLEKIEYGKVSAVAGDASYQCIEQVIRLALDREIDGTVTGPINKESLHAGGHNFSGHTEIYAHLTSSKDYAMLLADGDFRIVHVSTHTPLKDAIRQVKKDRIVTVTALLNDACIRFGVQTPRIGVAGLNPHASDGGLFGPEEEREISPAVHELRDMGIDAQGPIPPDTLFAKARAGFYDGCVAMYHDQGHIPFKLAGFSWNEKTGHMDTVRGVNITLGLPIVRTSVDHGTAFEIAGRGIANPSGLIQAIHMAVDLVAS